MSYIFLVLLFISAVFLIMLVLIQRGKGGGLAGALGGMGGQSAFGTKAGDTFTKITIGVAAFWILLCMVAVKYFSGSSSRLTQAAPATQQQENPGTPGAPGKSSDGAPAPAGGNTAPASGNPAPPAGAKK